VKNADRGFADVPLSTGFSKKENPMIFAIRGVAKAF